MRKEKQVKSYQRRTKSGKMVTVRAHTAKYDAAEDLKKSLGSGKEIAKLKKGSLPKIKYQAKYDNDEPPTKKRRKQPHTKDIEELNAVAAKNFAKALKKYRKSRDNRSK